MNISDLKKHLGQLLNVGFWGVTPEDPWIKILSRQIEEGRVGGIIFFGYNIQKWPEITYYNEEDDCMEYEVLGIENISLIEITDEYIELISGNDYQTPHLVRIELCSGVLTATYFEPSEFLVGLDFEEVLEQLQF